MPASSQSTPAETAISAISRASARLVRSSEIWTMGYFGGDERVMSENHNHEGREDGTKVTKAETSADCQLVLDCKPTSPALRDLRVFFVPS